MNSLSLMCMLKLNSLIKKETVCKTELSFLLQSPHHQKMSSKWIYNFPLNQKLFCSHVNFFFFFPQFLFDYFMDMVRNKEQSLYHVMKPVSAVSQPEKVIFFCNCLFNKKKLVDYLFINFKYCYSEKSCNFFCG